MTAPLDLERIENYTNAANAGPWGADYATCLQKTLKRSLYHVTKSGTGIWFADICGDKAECDAAFIANARSDVPLMLAEIKRLRAEVERLSAYIDSQPRELTEWEKLHGEY